jgi:hypothetical protein
MALNSTFTEIKLDDLMDVVKQKHEDGYRFVQVLCTRADNGIDMTYTFNKGNELANYNIRGIDTKTTTVPSVTDYYLVAFPFENEAHDLFGVNITGMAIDFHGTFYTTRIDEPMTVISPEQKAAREKAARIAKAKAAKAAKDAAAGGAKPDDGIDADMEAKLAAMDPEKAARVRAALKAKAAKAKEAKADQTQQPSSEKGGE